jgi:hypothetical protein
LTALLARFSSARSTHPVYGLPIGWAFAIWGIIFLTLGLFTGYQAIPLKYNGGLECELVGRIRMPVLALEVFNSAWIFLFGYEQFCAHTRPRTAHAHRRRGLGVVACPDHHRFASRLAQGSPCT